MYKINKILFTIIISGMFYSCEKEVVLNFEEEEQSLAIFSLFSPNDVFNQNFDVEVSTTQSILDNSDFEFLENANVTITSELIGATEEPISEKLSFTKLNNKIVYRTDNTLPKDGYTYMLTVENDGYPTVRAWSHVPAITEIQDLELSEFKKTKQNQLPGNTRYFSNATFKINNKLNIQNHYHLLVWLRFPNGWRSVYIEDDLLQEQLGAKATIINAESSLVFFGAHFDDDNFEDQIQTLNFDIAFSLSESDFPNEIKFELRSVSQDYHNYFVEGYRSSKAGNNPFFVASDNISNNIENGYGVFAGYATNDVIVPFRK